MFAASLVVFALNVLYLFIALLLVVLNYYFLKVAQLVLLCFRPLSIAILVKNGDFARFQLVCDELTDEMDGRMDGWTDTPLIEMRDRI